MEYLNISELSEYIKISKSTIYKMTSQRRIPFIKSRGSKKLLFKREAIDDWLAGHYCPTKKELDNNISKILKQNK
jgi:excisionase family DNA binding protein